MQQIQAQTKTEDKPHHTRQQRGPCDDIAEDNDCGYREHRDGESIAKAKEVDEIDPSEGRDGKRKCQEQIKITHDNNVFLRCITIFCANLEKNMILYAYRIEKIVC